MDEDVAESLLSFMKDPRSAITRVSETCVLLPSEIERQVSLTLAPKALAANRKGHVYLDVLHVRKGSLIEISTRSPANARIVSHEEHLSVSEYLIQYRFLSIWKSAVLPGKDRWKFTLSMANALDELTQIPRMSVEEAEKAFNRHFDARSKILKAVLAAPGVTVDPRHMTGLYVLCKRLVHRYFVLLRVRAADVKASAVEFAYRHEISEERVSSMPPLTEPKKPKKPRSVKDHNSRRFGKIRGRIAASRAGLASWIKGLMGISAQPTSFRIHTPWAKRSNHYVFSMDPAEGYFIARQAVMVRGKDGRVGWVKRKGQKEFKWSINTNQGRRTHIFMGNASSIQKPLYVGIHTTETPGRSTSRVFKLSWAVVFALVGFTGLALLGDEAAFATGALVLALAAVASFASAPPPTDGVLGPPLLSRFTPPALAFGIVVFLFWLASAQLQPGERITGFPDEVMSLGSVVWQSWLSAGFSLPLASTLFLAVWVTHRRAALHRNRSRVLLTTTIHSDNFY